MLDVLNRTRKSEGLIDTMTRSERLNHRDVCRMRRRHYQHAALDSAMHAGMDEDSCSHDHEHGESHHGHHGASHSALLETQQQVEKLKDQILRQQAEFDNTRRRMLREQQTQSEFATQKLVESLLPVLDNFDRALAAPGDNVQTLLSGIEMVRKQLASLLEQNGLTKVEALGATFDPNQHEAVSMAPAEDGQNENQITEVFQEGYLLKNRLIRPAMVKVSK